MIYREWPGGSEPISVIGFGGWQIGGPATLGGKQIGWGLVAEKQATAAVKKAVELGINFFDTADIYGLGKSERILGKVLNKMEQKSFVCTKFGNREGSDGQVEQDFSADWLKESVNGSLSRLRREKLDVLLLHSPPEDFNWREYDATPYDQLVSEGKIGRYGVSCSSAVGAKRVIESGFGSVVEVIYNLLDRRIEQEVLALALKRKVAVIVRMPLASGWLVQEWVDGGQDFEATDHRSSLPQKDVAWRRQSVKKLDFLRALPGGMTVSALRFCLASPGVATVIPGMRAVAEVEANIKAAALGPLPESVQLKVARAVPKPYDGW